MSSCLTSVSDGEVINLCGAKLHKIFDIYKFSFKKNKQFEDFLFGSLKDFRSVI